MRVRWCGVGVLVLVMAWCSACGDDDDAGAPGVDASDTTGPTPTGEPVRLMAVYEGIGAASASPEVPEGAIAAARAINARGGIDGRPVEIISCDTRNDPNIAGDCGRQAVSEGVVAMVGNLTLYSDEFMPLLEEHRIASVGLEPATASDFSSSASFPIAGGAPVVWAGMPAALAEGGAMHIALARVDVGPAEALGAFANAGLQRFDLTIARDVPVPPGAPDMSTYVAAALQDGTDAVVVGLPDQDAINFVLALRQVDPDIPIALSATQVGDVLEALQDDAEGIIQTASLTTALRNTAEAQYERDMAAAGYSDLTGFRLASYAAVLLVEEVARDLPDVTGPALFEALGQARDVDVGLTAPLQFATGGVGGLPRVFNPCLFATQIEEGVPVPLTGTFQDAYTGEDCPTPS